MIAAIEWANSTRLQGSDQVSLRGGRFLGFDPF